MAENGRHDGPPTHAVVFVWNGHEVRNQSYFLCFIFSFVWNGHVMWAQTCQLYISVWLLSNLSFDNLRGSRD